MPAPVTDLLPLFLELVALPSPSGEERAVADRVTEYLRELDLAVDEDEVGARIGSTIGNLFCRLEATEERGTPLFLCAHLDTVPPDGRLEPVVDEGFVRNAGGTILGADNKAAVAVMLEAVRRILAERRPHAGIELLFTPKEEVGLVGADAFDAGRLRAGIGYVYDHAAPIGEIMLGAPHQRRLDVLFRGRAAHAGMYPEEGRSAIAAAARAISDMTLGRLDDLTTTNAGVIRGGSARNIVPEFCSVELEARSHDEEKLAEVLKEMLDAVTFAAAVTDCEVETDMRSGARGYRFRRGDESVRLAAEALRRAGYEPRYGLTGGGADANVFNERGRQCVNLANGMVDIHTPEEHIAVSDLEGMVEVTLALVDVARETAADG